MGVADEVLEGSAKADGTVKSHLQSSQKHVCLQLADSQSPWCSHWPLFASAQEMQVVIHWDHLVEADLDLRQLMTAVALEHPVALRLAVPFIVVRVSFFYTSLLVVISIVWHLPLGRWITIHVAIFFNKVIWPGLEWKYTDQALGDAKV
jgi:hypothetical protein